MKVEEGGEREDDDEPRGRRRLLLGRGRPCEPNEASVKIGQESKASTVCL